MCRPTIEQKQGKLHHDLKKQKQSIQLWPLPLWLVVPLVTMLVVPDYILNRGYTQWFHWLSLVFFLSQDMWLCKFLAIQGTSITLGWYAALIYLCISNADFSGFHLLYHNMPFTNYMLDDEAQLDNGAWQTNVLKVASHVLDFLGHPILTLYYWKRCIRDNRLTTNEILGWSPILTSYGMSRIWSLVHCYHNFGTIWFWYVGYDVYVTNNLVGWYPAYIMEGIVYTSCIVYRILRTKSRGKH